MVISGGFGATLVSQGIAGLTRSSAAWATLNAEPREEVVPPGNWQFFPPFFFPTKNGGLLPKLRIFGGGSSNPSPSGSAMTR